MVGESCRKGGGGVKGVRGHVEKLGETGVQGSDGSCWEKYGVKGVRGHVGMFGGTGGQGSEGSCGEVVEEQGVKGVRGHVEKLEEQGARE